MRLLIALLLLLVMSASMVACGGKGNTDPAEESYVEEIVAPEPDLDIEPVAPAPELVPVKNTAPAPGGTDAENGITEAEFLEICEKSFNAIWRNPVNHAEATDYLAAELEWLQFYFDEAGYTLTDDKIGSYIAWRTANHPNPIPEFEFTPLNKATYALMLIGEVYTHPSSEYAELLDTSKVLWSGTPLVNPAMCAEGIWVRFELDGREVYVPGEEVSFTVSPYAQYAAIEKEIYSSATTPSTSTSTTEAVAGFTEVNEVVYATSTVNIRSSYSSDSARLGQLTTAQSVTRIGIGTGAASGWSKVSLSDGTIAYIHSSYLSLTKPTVSTRPCLKNGQHAQTADLFPPYCVDFPCNTQSIPASNRLVWRKNLSLLYTLSFIKQGLITQLLIVLVTLPVLVITVLVNPILLTYPIYQVVYVEMHPQVIKLVKRTRVQVKIVV